MRNIHTNWGNAAKVIPLTALAAALPGCSHHSATEACVWFVTAATRGIDFYGPVVWLCLGAVPIFVSLLITSVRVAVGPVAHVRSLAVTAARMLVAGCRALCVGGLMLASIGFVDAVYRALSDSFTWAALLRCGIHVIAIAAAVVLGRWLSALARELRTVRTRPIYTAIRSARVVELLRLRSEADIAARFASRAVANKNSSVSACGCLLFVFPIVVLIFDDASWVSTVLNWSHRARAWAEEIGLSSIVVACFAMLAGLHLQFPRATAIQMDGIAVRPSVRLAIVMASAFFLTLAFVIFDHPAIRILIAIFAMHALGRIADEGAVRGNAVAQGALDDETTAKLRRLIPLTASAQFTDSSDPDQLITSGVTESAQLDLKVGFDSLAHADVDQWRDIADLRRTEARVEFAEVSAMRATRGLRLTSLGGARSRPAELPIDPWNVTAVPLVVPETFSDTEHVVDLPASFNVVRQCEGCGGTGQVRVPCGNCNGSGITGSANSPGYGPSGSPMNPGGPGTVACMRCNGGQTKFWQVHGHCGGSGMLLCRRSVVTTWKLATARRATAEAFDDLVREASERDVERFSTEIRADRPSGSQPEIDDVVAGLERQTPAGTLLGAVRIRVYARDCVTIGRAGSDDDIVTRVGDRVDVRPKYGTLSWSELMCMGAESSFVFALVLTLPKLASLVPG